MLGYRMPEAGTRQRRAHANRGLLRPARGVLVIACEPRTGQDGNGLGRQCRHGHRRVGQAAQAGDPVRGTDKAGRLHRRLRGWLLSSVPPQYREAATEVLHWAVGAGGGAMFGVLPAAARTRSWIGAAYGLAMWPGFGTAAPGPEVNPAGDLQAVSA
jgi:hypothetical protein